MADGGSGMGVDSPIEAKAIQGYEICLKAATKESWFNEWSNMCEVEMNQMQPSEYPLAVERMREHLAA